MLLSDFYNGSAFDAFTFFGAHPSPEGVTFRVYAPAAQKVAVTGDFNNSYPWLMNGSNGIFEAFIPDLKPGTVYKFRIYDKQGNTHDHSDPYAFGMQLRPDWGSVVRNIDEYVFGDSEWLKNRDKNYNKPLNIYELHLGSWKQKTSHSDTDGTDEFDPKNWYSYSELADLLIPYLKKNNFTHVEFMPLSEHPADCSWGYQNTGFYAPTSRYGTARDLMELIDRLHQNGLGAIMDFVPVHFALDDYALKNFDGTNLFEYPESDVSISEWGTCNFLFNKPCNQVFMQSCANYWLEKFHFDGLRMDAISRAIYWQGEKERGVNPNSVDFIKQMNAGLQARHPDCMLIAEDSTSFPKITCPVEYGGLGFDYKWDLGWMNDTLDYFRTPPIERKAHHSKITFSMYYFYNELYLLEFSHDENVHGKATIIQKMWGDYEDKFPQARALYAYMFTHPGKKLNFMGGENAQFREWDESREQDWDILKYPLHDSFNKYFAKLCELYKALPALHNAEYNPISFRWLMADNSDQNVFVYMRCAENQNVLCAFNFSGAKQKVRLNVDRSGYSWLLTPIISSDEECYSGGTRHDEFVSLRSENAIDGEVFELELPKFSAVLYDVKEIKNN